MKKFKLSNALILTLIFLYSRNLLAISKNSFEMQLDNVHVKLGSTQTLGPGSTTVAKNILSEVRFGFSGTYKHVLAEKFVIGVFAGARLYDYSQDLSHKITNDQRTLALRTGLLLEFEPIAWLTFEDKIYLDQQLYYYGSTPIPPGNIIFNVGNVFRNDLGIHARAIQTKWFDTWIGGGLLLMEWGKNIDSGVGYIIDGSVPIHFIPGFSFKGGYSRLNFDFVTAKQTFELLELGINYQVEF